MVWTNEEEASLLLFFVRGGDWWKRTGLYQSGRGQPPCCFHNPVLFFCQRWGLVEEKWSGPIRKRSASLLFP